ncbi:Beta-catenin-like protein 1, related [Eimeria necatrix]|uniref:Beta-catenin-like protein 1, related n=1 Tax=Eimeria necatrix TaxID=51315 RepID=U6MT95_9EIME|nr:Beta-catenin-like protein 1, related [Eimeria necatrix]CDJ67427.1 Beta-catenin-like protein 1, related [Eimeria necatrix]
MGSHLPEMVVDLLCRLKEDGGEDDALGISSCLTVLENLIELNPSLSSTLIQSQKLPAFLFRRIRGPPAAANAFLVDGARLHAAEVLTLLLQHLGAPEKAQMGGRNGADGVDKLLRAIAPYRKKDPESSQEEELVLNLFDSLCSLLLVSDKP